MPERLVGCFLVWDGSGVDCFLYYFITLRLLLVFFFRVYMSIFFFVLDLGFFTLDAFDSYPYISSPTYWGFFTTASLGKFVVPKLKTAHVQKCHIPNIPSVYSSQNFPVSPGRLFLLYSFVV